MLHINTAMHNSDIWGIDTDAKGRFILTASQDKTARLWDAQTGELLRIFRPPIGQGNEGMLYTGAISPDAATIAVGGYTGYDWFGYSLVYIFSVKTGEMTRVITNHGDTVRCLAYSPDGKRLAVCLDRDAGVALYSTDNWTFVHLGGYREEVYKAAFYKNLYFAAVSYDGNIRLYDLKSLPRPIRSVTLTGGLQPCGVAFSPDGTKIAVGYSDRNRIQVLKFSDLSVLYEPDCTGGSDVYNLSRVSWSKDGRFLYAGGSYTIKMKDGWWCPIRKWSDGGRGDYSDYRAVYGTVRDIRTMPDDTIVYSGYGPDWGKMDKNGNVLIYKKGEVFPMNSSDTAYLRISGDAAGVSFKPVGGVSYTFSVTDRKLMPGENDYPGSIQEMEGITVSNYYYTTDPRLNGRSLNILADNEHSRCYAIHPSGEYILLGADWYLYYLNSDGSLVWKTPVNATVYSVSIAVSKEICAAAMGDGTIRWYRLRDGQELLTLFIDAATRKWVIWTPSGFYDCSAGGDNLIGWHINNGISRAADFFTASRFTGKYYRPGVIPLVLQYYGDPSFEETALNADSGNSAVSTNRVGMLLPPVVTILSPESGSYVDSRKIDLSVNIRSPSDSPVTEIRTLINGRPVANNYKGLSVTPSSREGETRNINLSLPEGESEITVLARNKNSWSEPATVKVAYRGGEPGVEFTIKPKLYLLAIGVSRYDNKEIQLKYPAKDANDFAQAMLDQTNSLYRGVVEKILTNDDATKDNILDALDWIQRETTSKDIAMIFLSGHGVNDRNGFFYYLPVNADLEKLKRTAVPFTDIKTTISSIAGKALFFVDTCHSGNIMGARKGLVDINGIVNELASAENGAVVFTSSTGNQYSLESDEWNNGAFTKALVEALKGKADYDKSGKGRITVNMIDLYISERVKELTKGEQTPTTAKPQTIADFPVAVDVLLH